MSVPDSHEQRPLLERALLALERSDARVQALLAAQHEPIAIIGAGCRLPGGVDDLDSFWDLLAEGRSGIGELAERFPADVLPAAAPAGGGKPSCRWAGLLKDVDAFDAQFFGISPKAAVCMDPQQRLMLEVAWEALESAGLDPFDLGDGSGGVFVSSGPNEYAPLLLASGEGVEPSGQMATGNSSSVVAGRLAYWLGWTGPALVVDTACSSSLVALHLACQSLRQGECDVALTGGVNLILSPISTAVISNNGMLSGDARCKVFDEAADGYIRSEGAVVLVLKRLGDALRNHDHVLGVVRGSAVTHNGRSQGLTAPNGRSQEAAVRRALRCAGVRARDVSYVETHGTGTPLGDPIEVASLAAAYAEGRHSGDPLYIGAVKANIGHCEPAAGAAGLLKLLLCLQRGAIPPQVSLNATNPHLAEWVTGDGILRIASAMRPWSGSRVGAVSSFGFSGTNAHAVVAEAPPPMGPSGRDRPARLMVLSGKTETALAELVKRHAEHLRVASDVELDDICFTANTGRARFAHRAAVWASDRLGLVQALTDLSQGSLSRTGVARGVSTERASPGMAFHFLDGFADNASLQDMPALLTVCPRFRRALEVLDVPAPPAFTTSVATLLEMGRGHGDALDDVYDVVLLHALGRTCVDLGVAPLGVSGQGRGMLAAAVLAGSLSAADALPLALTWRDSSAFETGLANVTFSVGSIPLRGDDGAAVTAEQLSSSVFWRAQRRDHTARASSTAEAHTFVFGSLQPSSGGDPESPWTQVLACVGRAFTAGLPVDLAGLDEDPRTRRRPIPGYPYARRRYWPGAAPHPDGRAAVEVDPGSGARLLAPADLNIAASVTEPVRLRDHRLNDSLVFPGAAHVSLALEAVCDANTHAVVSLTNITFPHAMALGEGERRSLVYRFQSLPDGGLRCRGDSCDESGAAEVSHLMADIRAEDTRRARSRPSAPPCAVAERIEGADLYLRLAARNYHLGETFHWIRSVSREPGRAVAELATPSVLDATSSFALPATLLDACFQVAACATSAKLEEDTASPMYVPFTVDRLTLTRHAGRAITCDARLVSEGADGDIVHDIELSDASGETVLEIEGLRSRKLHRKPRTQEPSAARLHDLVWRPLPPANRTHPTSGAWLILEDHLGIGAALAARLEAEGAHTIAIRPADGGLAQERRAIDPEQPEQMERLLASLPPLQGIVHLWSITDAASVSPDEPPLSHSRGWRGLLRTYQAIVRKDHPLAQLCIVTAGAQAVLPGEPVTAPAAAALWGIGRTLRLEAPKLQTTIVDLPADIAGGPAGLAEALHLELTGRPGDDAERALRAGVAYGPRLRTRSSLPPPPRLRKDRTYVITGGAGALGLACARQLAKWGAEHLVLLSRRTEVEAALSACADLAAQGVNVRRIAADVADLAVMERLWRGLEAAGPPVAGVFHAAGVLDDGVLARQSPEAFAAVLRPKVQGAWNLHRLTRDVGLEHYVLFSSAAGLLGSPGQSAYAAANACLDSLAFLRRGAGLPAVSLAWGAWAEIGMAARARAEGRGHSGLGGTMSTAAALDAFAAAFGDPPPLLAIGQVPSILNLRGAPTPAALLDLAPSAPTRERSGSRPLPFLAEIARLPPADRSEAVERYVAAEVCDVLGLESDQELDLATPLLDQGLDSLAAIELRDRFEDATSVSFTASLLFDSPSVSRLAQALLDALLPEDRALPVAEPQAPSRFEPADSYAGLPTAELERLLASELEAESEAAGA